MSIRGPEAISSPLTASHLPGIKELIGFRVDIWHEFDLEENGAPSRLESIDISICIVPHKHRIPSRPGN